MEGFTPSADVVRLPATITIVNNSSDQGGRLMDFPVSGQSTVGSPLASPLPLPSILQKQQMHSSSQSSLSQHNEQHTAATETDLSSMGSLTPMHSTADSPEDTHVSANNNESQIMEDSAMEDCVPMNEDDTAIDDDDDMVMDTDDTLMIPEDKEAAVIPAVATAAIPSAPPRRRSILKSSPNYQPVPSQHPHVPKLRKEVMFVTIQVRGYQQTLGDNPCVSYGPPVSLDWFYQDYGHFDLNAFEANRGPRRKVRQMCLNYYQRVQILQALGYSDGQIKDAEKLVQKCKIQRNLTRTLLPAKRLEEAMESAQRKAKRRWTPR